MTTTINFTGLGSNIDFNAVRDAIIADKMQPIAQLQSKSSDLTSRSEALKQLNGLLASLTDASAALTDTTLGTGRNAVSSNNTVASATATSAVLYGSSFNLNVTRLATNLTQASASFASTTTPILAGGATTATFELRKGGASTGTPITIDSTNNSLAGLRDTINGANAGVTASIIDLNGNGTQNQLVLTSTATGAAGRVELVETSATGTGAALNLTSLNPPGAVGDFSALDAQLSINGLTITRATNTISDATSGMTFGLHQTGAATITITQSSDIENKLQNFITTYNAVQDFIANQYKADSSGKPTGVLAGDPTLRLAQQQLSDSTNSFSSNNGGSLTNLTDLGIGRDENNKLTLDSSVLNDKLNNNLSDVQALLFGQPGGTGLFNSIDNAFSTLSDSVTGVVQTAITGYETSIKTLQKSIADQTDRINQLRDTLTKQYAAVESALNQLNSQGTSLTTIMDALKPKTN